MAGELDLVPASLAREVADAYRDYRSLQHKVRLTGAPHARVDAAPHAARRAAVTALLDARLRRTVAMSWNHCESQLPRSRSSSPAARAPPIRRQATLRNERIASWQKLCEGRGFTRGTPTFQDCVMGYDKEASNPPIK
jgi:hypothetical protein